MIDISIAQIGDCFFMRLEYNFLMLNISRTIALFLNIDLEVYLKRLIITMKNLGYTNIVMDTHDAIFKYVVNEKEKTNIINAFKEEFAPELTMITLTKGGSSIIWG